MAFPPTGPRFDIQPPTGPRSDRVPPRGPANAGGRSAPPTGPRNAGPQIHPWIPTGPRNGGPRPFTPAVTGSSSSQTVPTGPRNVGPQSIPALPIGPRDGGVRPAPVAPAATGKESSQPTPAGPSSEQSGADKVNAANPQPAMLEITGNWFCTAPRNDELLIRQTSLQIAKDWCCEYVAIRSAIHNTRTVPDGHGGKAYVNAPWHFTVELRRRKDNKDQRDEWMAGHIYTDTGRAVSGKCRYETKGLQKIEILQDQGIQENPELFAGSRPVCKSKIPCGKTFSIEFSTEGYKPRSWKELPAIRQSER